MPTDEQQTEKEKSLSQLIAGALMEISPESMQAVTNHPDSPKLAERVKQVLGMGEPTDAMTPQARQRYMEATGADIAAETPTTQPTPADEDAANLARLQAISDLAVEAHKQASAQKTTTPRQQEGMVEGLPKLLKKVLEESLTETKADIKALKTTISNEIQKRVK